MREGSTSLGALQRALAAAEGAGAEVELLDLGELDLPMYEPGRPLEDYGGNVGRLVESMSGADALVLSTAAYHGTLAGVTKNALDFTQFLGDGPRPYFDGKVVGLISVAGGDQAGAQSNEAMVNTVHALRGVVAPLMVAVPKVWQRSDDEGHITDDTYEERLDNLGRMVVEMSTKLNGPGARREESAGVEA